MCAKLWRMSHECCVMPMSHECCGMTYVVTYSPRRMFAMAYEGYICYGEYSQICHGATFMRLLVCLGEYEATHVSGRICSLHDITLMRHSYMQCVAVRCSALQCVAVRCSVLRSSELGGQIVKRDTFLSLLFFIFDVHCAILGLFCRYAWLLLVWLHLETWNAWNLTDLDTVILER